MKRLVLFVLMMFAFISVSFSDESWTGWMNFYTSATGQIEYYSIYYDTSKKSMVIRVDNYYPNTTLDPNAAPVNAFVLYENSNPKLFANVKEVLSVALNSMNQVNSPASGNAVMNNSAYYNFSFRYDSPIISTPYPIYPILGIKVRTYRP